MKVFTFGKTDIGKKRKNNEDCFLVDDDIRLYAVADGIGGHQAGEVASRTAIETFHAFVLGHYSGTADIDSVLAVLKKGFIEANAKIREAASGNPALSGMGTTMTAMLVRKDAACLTHIGDSRGYKLDNDSLTQLTKDHSLVAEQLRGALISPESARTSPYRHVITHALGIRPDAAIDQMTTEIRLGETFLLCTDGLTEMLEDRDIAAILHDQHPQNAADQLVEAANNNGGVDNITVVVIRIGGI